MTRLRTCRLSLLPATLFISVALHWFAMEFVTLVPSLSPAPLAVEPIEVFDKDLVADIDLEPGKTKTVANTEEAKNNNRPLNTDYYGKRDQTVAKNSQAKHGKVFSAESKAGANRSDETTSIMKPLSMADLALDSHPRGRWSLGESTEYEGSVSSESTSNDYLPNVSAGVRTLLNTREYRYFSYLERIRQAVASEWQRDVQRRIEALWLSGRPIAIGQDLITKLAINLNEQGAVTEVSVIRSSGSRTIDHAGESVFHRVGVFPNPPKGLANDVGMITLRWVFVLKVTPRIAELNRTGNSSDATEERYIR